jgi:hypothetical protein
LREVAALFNDQLHWLPIIWYRLIMRKQVDTKLQTQRAHTWPRMDTTNTNPYTQRINLQRSKLSKTKAMPRRKKEEEKTNTIDEMQ